MSDDHASDELDQREREREIVAAMAPPGFVIDHARAVNLVQQFFASSLDIVDDDEPMHNNLPMIYTSTERLERLENSHMRLTIRVKALEAELEAMQGGK